MATTRFRMGEFPQAQVGIFEFHGSDFSATASYFGLDLHEAWMIAHMRSPATGQRFHVTRPIMLRTSNGLSFSVSKEDGVYQDARGGEFLRGGTFDRDVNAAGELNFSGASGFWSGSATKTVEAVFGDQLSWRDSGQMSLTGDLLGPGMQTYIASRHGAASGGICHTGIFYEAEGEICGEAVSGIVILEHAFSPPGKILGDSVIRRRYVGAWNGFASVFDDGTSQYGHIAFGTGPFRFANFMDGDRHVCCPVMSVSTETHPNGLGSRIEYHLANGETWECVVEKNGTLMDMLALARKLGNSAQAHQGRVRRLGDDRTPRSYYSILEWIPERLIANAPDVEEDPPKGF